MTAYGDYLTAQVTAAIRQAIADSEPELTRIAQAGGAEAAGGLLGDVTDVVGIITGILGIIPIFGGLAGDAIGIIDPLKGAGGKLGQGFGIGYMLGSLLYPALEPLTRQLSHATEAALTSQILDPATAASLTARGIVSHAYGASEASGAGLDGSHFSFLADGAEQRPGLAELLVLLRRQEITLQQFSDALRHQGMPADWITHLEILGRVTLSPADLALAQLRGFLDPAVAQQYAQTLGVVQADFDTLVANTGEPPGLQEMLFAYRRNIIDKTRLEHGIKQSRVKDEWIDVVESLRFVPMSTADAINANVQNQLDDATARRITEENGLDPTMFDPLHGTYGSPLSREEMDSLWHRGIATQADVEQALRESHLKDKYIPFALALARRLIPYRTINTIIHSGVWTQQQGITYLQSIGYSADDAAALVATSTAVKTQAHKQITEQQILALYEEKGIKHEDAVKLLANIGYDSVQAQYILDAQLAKAALAEQKRAISAVRTAYLGDKIDKSKARGTLDALNVLSDQRDQLLADWEAELDSRVLTLTPAQVADAVKQQFVTWPDGHSRLVKLGYSENDANIFLAIHVKALPAGVTIGPL